MALKLVTAPEAEPLTIADVEAQIQYALPADQYELVKGYISAVRQKAETVLRRALVTQTWDLVIDAFPVPTSRNQFAAVEIPLPPLQSVDSVQYLDVSGQLVTLADTEYTVDADATPGRILPAYGKAWPFTLDYPGAVRVRFTAGYGAAADVPQCIRSWMLLNVASLYENRESAVVGNGGLIDLSTLADSLLDAERWGVRL